MGVKMADSPIPSLPTPPIRPKWRDIVYGVWSWAALLLFAVIAGWAYIETVPRILYGFAAGWMFVGSGAGFLAKNNVSRS